MSKHVKIDPVQLWAMIVPYSSQERGLLLSIFAEMWTSVGHLEFDAKIIARACHSRSPKVAALLDKSIKDKVFNVRDGRLFPGLKLQRVMVRVSLSAEQREEVLRHAEQCAYCGARDRKLVVDHVYPASKGGTNHRENLVAACEACNADKRDKETWRAQ